jgi:sugar lactone lactonase YvrE
MQLRLSRVTLPALVLLGTVGVGAALIAAASGDSRGRDGEGGPIRPPGDDASFTTVFKSDLGLEGLTGDRRGNLYSGGRDGEDPCPVFRVRASGGEPAVVGNIPAPCGPSGIAFGPDERLYIASEGQVHVLTPNAENPPTATVFATDVPGANGLAFDDRGDLWVSDGTTGQGRVWRVEPDGERSEEFRVQPMVNEVVAGGIGRDPRSLPPGTVDITPTGRSASNQLGSQHLVANGLAFGEDGSLYIGDTARGAIWRVELDRRGEVRSPVGCDTTFTANTLCLDNVFVAHPFLEGTDGIALDRAGNIWSAANERNAIVVVTARRRTVEFFRNPADGESRLRNEGPLEFPTSPFLSGRRLCITSSDGDRRDNSPSTGGEVGGPGVPEVAKISCLDEPLSIPGLPLPVR